ncbi:hypothetical protein MRX96_045378 [Rhipicephalus microplus]
MVTFKSELNDCTMNFVGSRPQSQAENASGSSGQAFEVFDGYVDRELGGEKSVASAVSRMTAGAGASHVDVSATSLCSAGTRTLVLAIAGVVGKAVDVNRHSFMALDVHNVVLSAPSKTMSCSGCVVSCELADVIAPTSGGIGQLELVCFGSVVVTA